MILNLTAGLSGSVFSSEHLQNWTFPHISVHCCLFSLKSHPKVDSDQSKSLKTAIQSDSVIIKWQLTKSFVPNKNKRHRKSLTFKFSRSWGKKQTNKSSQRVSHFCAHMRNIYVCFCFFREKTSAQGRERTKASMWITVLSFLQKSFLKLW